MKRTDTCSWKDDVVSYVAMLMIICLDMTVLTIVKAAMNDGLSSIVYVVYHSTLGTLILLPFFIVHILRKVDRQPLTFRILFRFFILGLLGLCLFEILVYVGIYYSSPTMASAIFNLFPGITFLIAVSFRTEKIDIRRSSSLAKVLGTIMAILGAMVFTFYEGPEIIATIPSLDSPNRLFLSQPPEWIFGGLLILIGGTFGCMWSVLQTTTMIEYSDQQTIVFFYCLFGTIQCIALSPFLERNRRAWVLQPGTRMTAVVFGALYSTAFRKTVVTWCLEKKGPVFVAMFSPLSIVIAVIMGVTFLGDSLHLGSVIGATIVSAGVYMVLWGQTKEKTKLLVVVDEDSDISGSSVDQTAHLLPSSTQSEC